MKKIYGIGGVLALFLAGIWLLSPSIFRVDTQSLKYETKRFQLGNQFLVAEIADTEEKRSRGLSFRESLGENSAMFFIFPEPGMHSFWMKDMLFPIDIVWIDENFRIVHILTDVRGESYPKAFSPPTPVRYVLEVNAKWVEQNSIRIGDTVITH